MKILKTREDAIKEAEYWKQSYSDTLKELLEVKAEYQQLRKSYVDDLEDVLNTLIKMRQEILNIKQAYKHARVNDERSN